MNSMIARMAQRRCSKALLGRWGVVALGAMSMMIGGCFTAPTPDLRIVSAKIVERTDAGAVIDVTIEGANRTAKDMKLRSIRYRMSLDGKRVFEGERTPQATFPALGVQSFSVPIATSITALPTGENAAYTFGATLMYLVPGPLAEAMYDLNVRKPTVKMTATGHLDLRSDVESAPASATPSTSN